MSLISSLIPSFTAAPVTKKNDHGDAAPQAADNTPTVTPRYRIIETDDAHGLVVELPGVAKDGLEISVDHAQIRVVGRRIWRKPEAWTTLHRETRDAAYELVIEHDRAIDVDKVQAELRDGLLRVSLPKAEALKPRKIAVS